MDRKNYDVIVWGTGMVGQHCLRYVIPHPELRLVGVKCYHEAKDGKDAADVAAGDFAPTGIKLTRDREAIINMKADIVLFAPFDPLSDPSVAGTPSSAWVPDLLDLLRSGKNVIASMLSIAHWRHLKNGEQLHAALDAAAREGNATLFVTGIDPGFIPDALAYAACGVVSEVKAINTWEVLDYGPYPELPTIRSLGFGSRPEDLPAGSMDVIRTAWGGCPYLLGEAFGVRIDEVVASADVAVAKETFTSESGLKIAEGTIEAIAFRVSGLRDGTPVFTVNHVTRMRQEAGEQFYRIGHDGGYAIDIDSYPPVKAEFLFGLPGGTGASWSDAMVMTSSRLVNSIESVADAPAGWRIFTELKNLGGRYAFAD
ncbi:4-hydroxy-tetrahydrodipicolinate reductase [Sphingobium faniae]|nr:4-hydroxy-tetrahydrodipicolinate reductase [Sphingobium faniae]